jgi:hypothetical protein
MFAVPSRATLRTVQRSLDDLKLVKLNLIAYSLDCLLTYTNEFLVAYVSIWQARYPELLFLLLR